MTDDGAVATEADVVNCYRVLLGREPENPQVVQHAVADRLRLWELVRRFLHSPEAADKALLEVSHRMYHNDYANEVDLEGTPEQLDRLFSHVRQTWAEFGTTEPYWSVIVAPEFRSSVMNAASEANFYSSGRGDCDRFAAACARNGIAQPTQGTVLDFGCGVGRLGEHLSHDFARYVGIDISTPHLALASERMAAIGRENCAFKTLTEFLDTDLRYDAFMSLIVLQHNPPPVMNFLLNRLLARLQPGGVGYFQLPCFLFNYRYDLAQHLRSLDQRTMEMHALPQRAVFAAIAANGCQLVEVTLDGLVGKDGISYTFLVRRP